MEREAPASSRTSWKNETFEKPFAGAAMGSSVKGAERMRCGMENSIAALPFSGGRPDFGREKSQQAFVLTSAFIRHESLLVVDADSFLSLREQHLITVFSEDAPPARIES